MAASHESSLDSQESDADTTARDLPSVALVGSGSRPLFPSLQIAMPHSLYWAGVVVLPPAVSVVVSRAMDRLGARTFSSACGVASAIGAGIAMADLHDGPDPMRPAVVALLAGVLGAVAASATAGSTDERQTSPGWAAIAAICGVSLAIALAYGLLLGNGSLTLRVLVAGIIGSELSLPYFLRMFCARLRASTEASSVLAWRAIYVCSTCLVLYLPAPFVVGTMGPRHSSTQIYALYPAMAPIIIKVVNTWSSVSTRTCFLYLSVVLGSAALAGYGVHRRTARWEPRSRRTARFGLLVGLLVISGLQGALASYLILILYAIAHC